METFQMTDIWLSQVLLVLRSIDVAKHLHDMQDVPTFGLP